MANKIIKAQMKQRRDTKANWAAQNPVLLAGELGIVSDDPNLYKVGDGTTAWNALPFRGFNGTVVNETGTSETAVMSQKGVTEALQDMSAEMSLQLVKTITGKYISTGGGLSSTTGDAAVFVFEVPNCKFLVQIPRTGNEYHAFYALSDDLVDSGYISNAHGTGTEASASLLLDGTAITYKYIYVSARPSFGQPLLFIKGISSEVNLKPRSVTPGNLDLFDSYPVCTTSAQRDMNSVIEEIYLLPEFSAVPDLNYRIRPYGKGFIFGAFSTTKREWAVRCYNIKDNYGNHELIPLIVNTTTSSVTDGTLVGYCTIKDIDTLSTMPEETATEGETVDLGKASQLFLNPRISTLLNMPEQSSIGTTSALIDGVDITLPEEFTAVEGDTLQIFWRSIIGASNPYIFDIIAISSVGKSYPRYYTFTPTAAQVGQSYPINIIVRGNDGRTIISKQATIRVRAKMTNPSATKKVLCIGASATAGGIWPGELLRRLAHSDGNGTSQNPTGLGLSNITFVGRKTGTSNPVQLEATGGWTVQAYASKGEKALRFQVKNVDTLSLGAIYTAGTNVFAIQEINVTEGVGNIRCTLQSSYTAPAASGTLTKTSGAGDATITYTSFTEETFSPFWNESTGKLDFSQYANNYCGGQIDVMVWHCGVNDIAGVKLSYVAETISKTIAAFKDILRAYHTQFPSGKVIISSVPIGSVNGGFAANYGAAEGLNYFEFTKKAQMYAQALETLCKDAEFSGFTAYSAVLEEFDAEYGYPTAKTPVNNRSEIQEDLGTNGVHPINSGSYMVADAIYRTMHALAL